MQGYMKAKSPVRVIQYKDVHSLPEIIDFLGWKDVRYAHGLTHTRFTGRMTSQALSIRPSEWIIKHPGDHHQVLPDRLMREYYDPVLLSEELDKVQAGVATGWSIHDAAGRVMAQGQLASPVTLVGRGTVKFTVDFDF